MFLALTVLSIFFLKLLYGLSHPHNGDLFGIYLAMQIHSVYINICEIFSEILTVCLKENYTIKGLDPSLFKVKTIFKGN